MAVVPGVDGRKMSKSYNNTIEIFDDPEVIRKKCKKIVTDSTPVEAPKNPDTCPLFGLYRLFAAADDLAEVERRYREGGIGYGEMKTRLADAIIGAVRPGRASGGRNGSRIPNGWPRFGRRRRAGRAHGAGRPGPGPRGLRGELRPRDVRRGKLADRG